MAFSGTCSRWGSVPDAGNKMTAFQIPCVHPFMRKNIFRARVWLTVSVTRVPACHAAYLWVAPHCKGVLNLSPFLSILQDWFFS